ncbi:hypothetical protein Tco_0660942 [Tanacetum coccineum]
MTTLAEFMIIAGADNRPPMLEKSLTKKYEELSVVEKLQANYDLKATNIVLQGLPPDVYAIVNHHKVGKDIWDRVKLLMQGTKLFAQLINNVNAINMSMRPVQVNIKFLNSLPPEWSKFMMDVKLARDLYTINYDQLYLYLEQHERHANETRLMRERYQNPLAFLLQYSLQPTINLELPLIEETKPLFKMEGLLYNKFKGGKDKVMLIEDLDAYDFDCHDVLNAKVVLMANLSNYGYDKAQQIKPTLYDGSVISKQHVASLVFDDEETLILEEVSRSKMLAKQNDPISKEKKVNTTPINYAELNQLSEDFGKHFVPQRELSDEQAFWLQTLHPNTD